MSELAELFLIFLVIYLFETLAFVPGRTVGFFSFLGRWRARIAFRPNASWSVAVVIGKPWPPLSPPWLAEAFPFAVDREGITLIEVEGERLAWEDLEGIEAYGNKVHCGDRVLATMTSRRSATLLCEAVETIRNSPAPKRERSVRDFLDTRFDLAVPRARREDFGKRTRVQRALANALWLSMFGGLGAAVVTQNMLYLLFAAALSLLLWPVHSVVFWLTLRKLPRSLRPDGSKCLVAMLSPISGVRAADLFARDAWADLDPLTVAAALLRGRDLEDFARPRLVAMQPRQGDPLAWWRAEILSRIERVLREQKVDVAAMLAPPRRDGAFALTYCPACLAQYEQGRKAGDLCPNESCPKIPLRAFPEVAGSPKVIT